MGCRRLLNDPERCRKMTLAQRSQVAADAADQEVNLLETRLRGEKTV